MTSRPWQAALRAKRKAANLCVRCGSGAAKKADGLYHHLCEDCRRDDNKRSNARRKARKLANKCPGCGSVPKVGGIYCEGCLEYQRVMRQHYREIGKKRKPGKPKELAVSHGD